MSIVIDASLALRWLFQDEADADSDRIYDELQSRKCDALVPDLFYLEVLNTLMMGEKRGRATKAECDSFLSSLLALPIIAVRISPADLPRIRALAIQQQLTVYDAVYLDLSLSRSLSLHSRDQKLVTAFNMLSKPE